MAAPQVAAAAALLWAKEPEMKPYQIRSMIYRTADHLDPSGWNPKSGYGILRVDKLLSEPNPDYMEGDNISKKLAKPLPMENMISAQLPNGKGEHWYYIDPSYPGTLSIQIVGRNDEPVALQLIYYCENGTQTRSYNVRSIKAIELPVTKKRSYIQIKLENPITNQLTYNLTTKFQIYIPPYGDNHSMYNAYTTLPLRSQEITGTFTQMDQVDWFMLPVLQSGTLRVDVSADTPRIDLALTFFKQGEKELIIDQRIEGESEFLPTRKLSSGKY